MLEKYVFVGNKKLRCGYTTGSCAAAAAKASAYMLLTGKSTHFSDIITPDNTPLHLGIINQDINENYASCAVVKDGGDDPDITSGIEIYARVSLISCGITITGGNGIGIVTKAGLDQPVGEYAINSTPRKMIAVAVSEIAEELGYSGGFHVEIFAPQGESVAKKTYNPRMGIMGGISIIGTSGIVEPMSNSALVQTIRTEAKMLKAQGIKNILLTLGNYSESFISENMPFPLENSIKCSNFIGDAIEISKEFEFDSALIVGHIGKLIKLGAGIMNTHSAFADGRMEVLTSCGVIAGVSSDILKNIQNCATVDAALDIIADTGLLNDVLSELVKKIEYHLNIKSADLIKIGAVVFSFKHDFILKTHNADEIISCLGGKNG
ncbi:MAG: cobalamin biosynthesis protein CbiD [Ruminococcus sp.]|nr:cobalamin biosynthesis protein CbiD [Ruminococcus sp.]